MKLSLLVFLLFIFTATSHANDSPWQLKRQANGIKVTQQQTKSGYPTTRGYMEVDSSADALVAVIRDNSACQRWLFSCKQSKLVKIDSATKRLSYIVLDLPLLFADRDMYVYADVSENKATDTVLVTLKGKENHDKGQKGKVRIKDFKGFWKMQKLPNGKTSVLYQVYSNPQLPSIGFLNNEVAKSVFITMSNIVKVSKEAKYRNTKLAELK